MSGGAHPSFCSVHVHVTFLEGWCLGPWAASPRHGKEGGSSWEGGTLPSKAARQLWHGYPLQTGREPVHCHCPLRDITFVLLRCELGLGSVHRPPETFKDLALPPVAGKSSTLTGVTCCYCEGRSLSLPFMFSHLSASDKLKLCPCYAESGTSKGEPEFAMSRRVFLLSSQLLPVLFTAYCVQSWSGWDTPLWCV